MPRPVRFGGSCSCGDRARDQARIAEADDPRHLNLSYGGLVSLVSMAQTQDNPEPPPAVCPACGYDMAGALGVTCAECGADVLEARVRLGPQRSAAIVIVPLVVGTLSWLFFLWVLGYAGTVVNGSVFDSAFNVLLLVTLATQVLSLIASIVFAWRFSRASCRTQDRWIVLAWLAFFLPLVLWPLPVILFFL